jgi:hypothetical protein
VPARAGILAAVLLIGCAEPPPSIGPSLNASISVPMYRAGGQGSEQARHTGRLAVLDECLVIIDEAGEAYTIAWPSPFAHWDPLTRTIAIRGVRARLGATVSIGGGEGQPTEETAWVRPPAAACFENPFWFAGDTMVVVDPG